ncbi:hypothetical protein LTS18_001028, partial [Coniosporium uncinatum]
PNCVGPVYPEYDLLARDVNVIVGETFHSIDCHFQNTILATDSYTLAEHAVKDLNHLEVCQTCGRLEEPADGRDYAEFQAWNNQSVVHQFFAETLNCWDVPLCQSEVSNFGVTKEGYWCQLWSKPGCTGSLETAFDTPDYIHRYGSEAVHMPTVNSIKCGRIKEYAAIDKRAVVVTVTAPSTANTSLVSYEPLTPLLPTATPGSEDKRFVCPEDLIQAYPDIMVFNNALTTEESPQPNGDCSNTDIPDRKPIKICANSSFADPCYNGCSWLNACYNLPDTLDNLASSITSFEGTFRVFWQDQNCQGSGGVLLTSDRPIEHLENTLENDVLSSFKCWDQNAPNDGKDLPSYATPANDDAAFAWYTDSAPILVDTTIEATIISGTSTVESFTASAPLLTAAPPAAQSTEA